MTEFLHRYLVGSKFESRIRKIFLKRRLGDPAALRLRRLFLILGTPGSDRVQAPFDSPAGSPRRCRSKLSGLKPLTRWWARLQQLGWRSRAESDVALAFLYQINFRIELEVRFS